MKKLFIIIIVSAVALFVACSQKNTPSKTTTGVTAPPKVKATTYTDAVLPLIQSKCAPCHLPSKGGRKADFENFASAVKNAPGMVSRIQLNPTDRGFMPFKSAKLSDDDIAVFKKWVSDGLQEK